MIFDLSYIQSGLKLKIFVLHNLSFILLQNILCSIGYAKKVDAM